MSAFLLYSCGSSTGSGTSSPAANHLIAGGAGCPPGEAQDLTFSGSLQGHVKCSTSKAACTKAFAIRQGSGGLAFPLNARIGTTAVQLLIVFVNEYLGEFPAGSVGDEPSSARQGVTLDGIGHWGTLASGGTMSLVTDDGMSASGALDVTLSSGAQTIAVKGTWRCVKPAGF